MKIALTTIGSTGNFYPYLALAKALRNTGHIVRICSIQEYEAEARQSGIDYAVVGKSLEFQDEWGRAMDIFSRRKVRFSLPFLQYFFILRNIFLKYADEIYADYLASIRGFDGGVCHAFDFLGQQAMLQHGIPWAGNFVCPSVIPNESSAPPPVPDGGPTWNRFWWRAARLATIPFNHNIHRRIYRVTGHRRCHPIYCSPSPYRNFISCAPLASVLPRTLPPRFYATGPWLDRDPDYVPPSELVTFLRRYPNPIVIGFGSVGDDPAETSRLVIDAVERCQRPAIIQRGYEGLGHDALPDSILCVPAVPHTWLYKQAACVVHHAGPGTASAVCYAGVPSVPIPHVLNQFFWADRLHREGVATRPIPREKLTAAALAAGIQEALNSTWMTTNAKNVAQRINVDVALQRTVRLIEEFVQQRTR